MGVKILGCLLFMFVFFSGCRVFKPIKMESRHQMPTSFADTSDTVSIAYIPRKQFFTDSNLIRLIDTALTYNLDLQRAIQRIQFIRAGMNFARGRYLPVLTIGASAGIDKFGDYTMNGTGNFDTNLSPNIAPDKKIPNPYTDFFAGARSSWEISLWGNNRHLRKAAKARFLASEMGKNLVITSLISDIAVLYYELLALDNELLTIKKNLDLQQKALETVQSLKDEGKANELAVQQFEAQYLNTRSLEAELEQRIVKTENTLNLYSGKFPQPVKRGLPIREQLLPEPLTTGVPSAMLLRRPDIRQAEYELIAAKADVKFARASFLPSLTITSYAGFNAFKTPLLFSNPASLAYGVLSGLYAPILNRSFLRSNYNKSVAYQLDSYYAYRKSIINGFQEVVTSLNGIKNYERVYQLKSNETDALLKAVIASKDLFVAGYASYLEVITAQKYVLQAELELSLAKKNQFNSVIDLYRSLGGGWE